MSDTPNFAVVILAAGQGTRMRSDTHKVLHPIAGKALLMPACHSPPHDACIRVAEAFSNS